MKFIYLIKCLDNYENFENYIIESNEHKLIKLLLNSSFNENINIIQINERDQLKLFLIKIIWLHSNKDYIKLCETY